MSVGQSLRVFGCLLHASCDDVHQFSSFIDLLDETENDADSDIVPLDAIPKFGCLLVNLAFGWLYGGVSYKHFGRIHPTKL